jgi:hypothetical protein
MIGDDIDADVLAAQRYGITGVLVKTGKYLPEAVAAADCDADGAGAGGAAEWSLPERARKNVTAAVSTMTAAKVALSTHQRRARWGASGGLSSRVELIATSSAIYPASVAVGPSRQGRMTHPRGQRS